MMITNHAGRITLYGMIWLRGMVFISVLIIYFIRIYDQSVLREAFFYNNQGKESTPLLFISGNNINRAEDRSTLHTFRLSNKKKKDGFGLTANAEPFITARSINQQSR